MRRSAIIFTTIVSMVLCVSLLAFSVYAHLTQTFSVSNTIGFSPADDVFVALECRISGASQTQLNNPPSGYDSVEDYLYAVGIYKDVEFRVAPFFPSEAFACRLSCGKGLFCPHRYEVAFYFSDEAECEAKYFAVDCVIE